MTYKPVPTKETGGVKVAVVEAPSELDLLGSILRQLEILTFQLSLVTGTTIERDEIGD